MQLNPERAVHHMVTSPCHFARPLTNDRGPSTNDGLACPNLSVSGFQLCVTLNTVKGLID